MPVSRTPSATPSTANSPRTSHLALIVMIGLCLFFIVSYAGRVMQRTYLEAEAVRWASVWPAQKALQMVHHIDVAQAVLLAAKLTLDPSGVILPAEEI